MTVTSVTGQYGALVRVFLLDDHEVLRGFLRDLIDAEDDLTVVGTAGTAAEAMVMLTTTLPDVAVLDVHLPDRDGIEVCRDIRATYPEVQCLMLTSYPDEEALAAAAGAGASAYLLKQVPGDELVDAIRRVGRGELMLRRPIPAPMPPPPLTPVEPTVEVPVEPTVEVPSEPPVGVPVGGPPESTGADLFVQPPPDEALTEDALVFGDPNAVPERELDAFVSGEAAEPAAAAGTPAPGATTVATEAGGGGRGEGRRARWLIPVGFLAGVAAVVLLAANPFSSGTKSHNAAPTSVTTSVTTAPETTAPPTTEAPTTVPGPPPAPAPPGVASRMAFSYPYADCVGGRLSVPGSVTNNAAGTYSLTFRVSVVRSDGSVLGTASAAAAHLGAGESRSFTATGSCNGGPLTGRPSTQIDSITAG